MTEITTNGLEAHGRPSGRKNSILVPKQSNGKASYAEQRKVADHFIGGNRTENAPDSKVKEFVGANDGHTVITNVSDLRIWKGRRNKRDGVLESNGARQRADLPCDL